MALLTMGGGGESGSTNGSDENRQDFRVHKKYYKTSETIKKKS
jgi:hypothetical protein